MPKIERWENVRLCGRPTLGSRNTKPGLLTMK
jgi:hypothetical protein